MKEQLKQIFEEAKKDIASITDEKVLDEIRVKYLGKKGVLKQSLGQLGKMSGDMRKEVGKFANQVKGDLTTALDQAHLEIKKAQKAARLQVGVADISAPQVAYPKGYYHPLTLVRDRMIEIFQVMGFALAEGPELEEEFYNFDALNIPPYHPARDDHDSFYIKPGWLMRTHTSPVQIRTMKGQKPPIAIVVPGRCFRRDAVDATHSHTFHQMEGLVVDKGLSFSDLKGTLQTWAKLMFGEKTRIRMRPDFFPFTEPSAELAVSCHVCGGKGCSVCKGSGWIEIAGCGMVDPQVLKNVDLDPDKVSGFAFGMGLERIAMKLYGIGDIRQFFDNDMRFLEQFIK